MTKLHTECEGKDRCRVRQDINKGMLLGAREGC